MKDVTLSVAPPGPPEVILIIISASFNLKIMRIRIAVIDTGSISGNVTSQNRVQALAPSTSAASCNSLGMAWSPARIMIIINGMYVHASMSMIIKRAISGEEKNDGFSTPISRSIRAIGPNRFSNIDLPIIHETATGDSIRGNKNATRKNLRPLI